MRSIQASIFVGAILLRNRVIAHGIVTGIAVGGTYYQGYSPSFQFANPTPKVAGWSSPEDLSLGFIDPSNYTTPEIICHLGATPGAKYATVAAGGTVELQWSVWPTSHHGPVIDYLANCNGDCIDVDKTTLLFNKIDGVGLISDATAPGIWASDQLIAANNSWTITIPATIAPGSYVLRHEIIALHSAETTNGAQNYPQCVNLNITGSGTDGLSSGTLGTSLYTANDPGILFNIYTRSLSYTVPGPTLLADAIKSTSVVAPTVASPTSATLANITSTLMTSTVLSSTDLSVISSTATAVVTTPCSVSTVVTVSALASPTAFSTTPAEIVSSLIVPARISSTGPGLQSSLPPAYSNPAPGITSNNASALNPGTSATDIPLPAGLTLNEFFVWLQGVAINMFRSGRGPSAERAKQHARAVRL